MRYRALYKAYEVGLALPPEILGDLVRHDSSELMRMTAVEATGNHPSLHEHDKMALARAAINDDSPAVQTRAGEIVSHLEVAPLIREQDQELYDEAAQEMSDEFPDGNVNGQAGGSLMERQPSREIFQ